MEKGKNALSLSVYDIATNKATAATQALKPGNLTDGLVVADGGLPSRITTTTSGYQSGKQGNFYTLSGRHPRGLTGPGQPQPVTLNADHTFSVTLPITYGNNPFVFSATNKYGNVTTLTQNVNSDNGGVVAKGPQAVSFDNGVVFGVNSVNAKTKGYDAQTGTLTVTGKFARKSTTLRVAGKPVVIKRNLTFKLQLHVGTHASAVFPILVGDRAGKTQTQEQLTFYVDGVGPTLTLKAPKITAGSKKYAPIYTNQADFKLMGTMRDSYPYYALFVNQNEVAEAQYFLAWVKKMGLEYVHGTCH